MINPEQLRPLAVLAVVQHGVDLTVSDPDADGAFALQLTDPPRNMLEMTRGRRGRRNIRVWRCYGLVSGRPAAVSIPQDTPAVWAAESLLDWPTRALLGSGA